MIIEPPGFRVNISVYEIVQGVNSPKRIPVNRKRKPGFLNKNSLLIEEVVIFKIIASTYKIVLLVILNCIMMMVRTVVQWVSDVAPLLSKCARQSIEKQNEQAEFEFHSTQILKMRLLILQNQQWQTGVISQFVGMTGLEHAL